MGQSTDAYLFYGYCWNEYIEDLDFSTDMDEVVKTILTGRGMTDPWDVHYNGDYEAYKRWEAVPENAAEVDAYRAATEQVKGELGVDWDDHCSDDYPMPYLYVTGTQTTASRGKIGRAH